MEAVPMGQTSFWGTRTAMSGLQLFHAGHLQNIVRLLRSPLTRWGLSAVVGKHVLRLLCTVGLNCCWHVHICCTYQPVDAVVPLA